MGHKISQIIYNRMSANRIRPQLDLDPLLCANQNGLQPGRSTVAQILTIRRLVEGIKAKNLTAVLTFVDFKKVFDSVNRDKIINIVRHSDCLQHPRSNSLGYRVNVS